MLKVFAYAGLKRLEAELQEHNTLAKAAAHSTPSKNSSSSSSRPSKLQKLWAHAGNRADPQTPQQQQEEAPQQPLQRQQQQQQPACTPAGEPDLLPAASQVRSWALSPHIDLQLQAPPLLLLQQAVFRAAQLCRDQQQGQNRPAPLEILQQQQQLLLHQPGSCNTQQQQHEYDQDGGITLLQEVLSQLEQQQRQQEQGPANAMSEAWETLLDGSPVVQLLQSAFAPSSSADGGSTQAAALGGVLQQLCDAATTLAARCLVEQVLQANQQPQANQVGLTANQGVPQANLEALPLQALQLLAAVQQLQATAQAAASLAAAAAAARSNAAECARDLASCVRGEQQAKQLLVQQCLTLLQLVRTLREAPAGSPAAPEPSSSTEASATSSSGGSRSLNSSGRSSSQVMSPSELFAAAGPLSSCWGREVPSEAAGLWEGTCAARDVDNTHQPATTATATASGAAPWQTNQEVQSLITCLLRASAIACDLQGEVSGLLGNLLQHPGVLEGFQEVTRMVKLQLRGTGRTHIIDTMQWCHDKARLAQGGLPHIGPEQIVLVGPHLSELVGAFVSQLRSRLCGMYGLSAYSATAWQALLGANSFVERAKGVDDQQIDSDSDSDDSSSSSSSLFFEQGAAAAGAAAGAGPAHSQSSGWGSGCSGSSSSGGGDRHHRGQWHGPQEVRVLQLFVGQVMQDLGPSDRQEIEQARQEAEVAIPKAARQLR
jgi:hypothetical protein